MSVLDAKADVEKAEIELIVTGSDCPQFFPEIAEVIGQSDFENANNRIIWGAMQSLYEDGKLEGLDSVLIWLRRHNYADTAEVFMEYHREIGVNFAWKPRAARVKEAKQERFLKEQLTRAICDLDRDHDAKTIAGRVATITEQTLVDDAPKPLMGLK